MFKDEKNCNVSDNVGTLIYTSPESINSKTFKAKPLDIWSLGVTLYQLSIGKLPFKDSNIGKLK